MTSEPKQILIVDDDADFNEALAFLLQQHGYAVRKAYDGREGLRLAQMERPDLIIMDIMMGERTEGFFAIQEIRHTPELKNVPVFVVSALYDKVPDFRIAPDSGWMAQDEFISKPVDTSQLLEKIRQRIGPGAPQESQT